MGKTLADLVLCSAVVSCSVAASMIVSDVTGDVYHVQGIVLLFFFCLFGFPVFWIKNKYIENSNGTIYMTEGQKRNASR